MVGKFVSSENNLLVNNIVVAFEEPVEYRNGRLKITQITCSAWIIDGQHRLYGFLNLPAAVDGNEVRRRYNLIVSGIRGGKGTKGRRLQAQLFREINEYQRKIERNLLLDLYHYLEINDDKRILTRVDVAKRLRKTSPFKDKLRILPTQTGKVTLATIVDYKIFEDIVMQYGKSTFAVCKHYFEAVETIFNIEWNDPKKYVLCTNKGVRMLLSLLSRILRHIRSTGKRPLPGQFKHYLNHLKKSVRSEPDFFLNTTYRGKALGAGAPDQISMSIWATRIHGSVKGFLTQKELEDVFLGDTNLVESLESTLRECLKVALGTDYFSKLPQEIREDAEKHRKAEAKKSPWKKETDPPESFLNFSSFRLIMTSKRLWAPHFEDMFPSKGWFSERMNELEAIRNRLQHFRPLDQSEKSKLAMYTKEIIDAYSNWKEMQTKSNL